MPHIVLRCIKCGSSHISDMKTLECNSCSSPLDVNYSDNGKGLSGFQLSNWEGPKIPLPIHSADSLVTLGEGNTPSVALPAVGKILGLRRLFAKLEFMNPTGSFKDRGTAVMISVAKEAGVTEIVEDSSGNAGASVSAYAARASITAHIFAPATAPEAKIQQIKVYGAQSHAIEGPREACTEAAIAFYRENNLIYASHNMSPFFIEGTKTFAYELVQQFGREMPDHVVMPVGNGSLFIGGWKGFQELIDTRYLSKAPKMHCIQAKAVMPIVAAAHGEQWDIEQADSTVAGGISVGVPPRLPQALKVLRASGGSAVAVDDEAIIKWHKLMAEQEGIYIEPTSAAAFAGLEQLVNDKTIKSNEIVLVPITGFGLKDAPPS